jgi:hypothetical protein
MIWRILSFSLLLILSDTSIAAVGKVTELVNTPPSIQRQNNSITADRGTGVEMNDAIKTARGKVGITFEDDTRVQINENSKLIIDDFVYDPKSKAGKLGAKIALGTVRYASGQIAKNSPQNVALNTPTATISVRGTDFTATVDELGQSTIILLPSCPDNKPNRTKQDIEKNCVIGTIIVESDAGQVILNQAFQATRVENRSAAPMKPTILNLSEDAIGNMLLLSPPRELRKEGSDNFRVSKNFLDVDFLKEQGLANQLDLQQAKIFQDRLSYEFLDTSFLNGLFDMIGDVLNEKLLDEVDTVLPDYRRSSGIVAIKDESRVELCRNDGSNIQCVATPLTQNSTIYQTQGSLEFKNRVNAGGNTIITLIQR